MTNAEPDRTPEAKRWTAAEIAERVGGELEGYGACEIVDVRSLDDAGPQHLSFAGDERNEAKLGDATAGCLILRPGVEGAAPAVIRHPLPQLAFARAIPLFRSGAPSPAVGVHPTASVHETAEIGDGARIGPLAVVEAGAIVGAGAIVSAQAYVGHGARIGESALLHPRSVVTHGCAVGARSVIHCGAVIGSDGFGFATDLQTGTHHKVPQVGIVVIEDDCEIGANTTIDRAALTETRIGRGTKVDNLVQIAHNVQIGAGSIVVAQAGISGSTKLGRGCVVAAQAGIVGHLEIGDRAIVGASAGVTKNVPAGAIVLGQPAMPAHQAKRALALIHRLPEIWRTVRRLQKRFGTPDRPL